MLHIVFTPGGAGLLRRALRSMGLEQPVLAFPDDLSVGPIGTTTPSDRDKWIAENIYPSDFRLSKAIEKHKWPSRGDQLTEFWSRTLDSEECTVWLTRRIAQEYCGFLEWVVQAGSRPYNVVDLTDTKFKTSNKLIFSLAYAVPEYVDYKYLLGSAQPLRSAARDEYISLWIELCRENTPLRVLEEGQLVSASFTYFDDFLLSYVREEWRKVSFIVGLAIAGLWDDVSAFSGDEVMFARMFALFKAGRTEAKGDLEDWWRSAEIRLPVAGHQT